MTDEPKNLKIDDEFRKLIPRLSQEEYDQLKDNIKKDGCRDPLTVWAGHDILLDGHNRYTICTEFGLPCEVIQVECADREAAKDWIDKNQLGRRNLDPGQMSLLRGRIYNRTKKAHGERGPEKMDQSDPSFSTAERLAQVQGVSAPTIKRDGAFAEAAEKLGIESAIVSGEINAPRQAVIGMAKDLPEEPTEEQRKRVVEKLKKPRVARKSRAHEVYTPRYLIEAAVAVMGAIDCDPAGSTDANKIVRAAAYHDAKAGLEKEWGKTVWLSPPPAQPLIGRYCSALREKVKQGEVEQACVLVKNATETEWFASLVSVASAVVFINDHIKSPDVNGDLKKAPPAGQAIVYVGENEAAFLDCFGRFGWGVSLRGVDAGADRPCCTEPSKVGNEGTS